MGLLVQTGLCFWRDGGLSFQREAHCQCVEPNWLRYHGAVVGTPRLGWQEEQATAQ